MDGGLVSWVGPDGTEVSRHHRSTAGRRRIAPRPSTRCTGRRPGLKELELVAISPCGVRISFPLPDGAPGPWRLRLSFAANTLWRRRGWFVAGSILFDRTGRRGLSLTWDDDLRWEWPWVEGWRRAASRSGGRRRAAMADIAAVVFAPDPAGRKLPMVSADRSSWPHWPDPRRAPPRGPGDRDDSPGTGGHRPTVVYPDGGDGQTVLPGPALAQPRRTGPIRFLIDVPVARTGKVSIFDVRGRCCGASTPGRVPPRGLGRAGFRRAAGVLGNLLPPAGRIRSGDDAQGGASPLTRPLILALLAVTLAAGSAVAGPLYDPFLERFQVGAYATMPRWSTLRRGFPADLLEPVRSIRSGSRPPCRPSSRDEADGLLTRPLCWSQLLPRIGPPWYGDLARRVPGPPGGDGPLVEDPTDFLAARLAAWRSSTSSPRATTGGRRPDLAAWLTGHRRPWACRSARELFVWELRARTCWTVSDDHQRAGPPAIWPSMLDLAPLDTGNAWAVWAPTAQHFHASLLPPVQVRRIPGKFLAAAWRDSGITPAELYEFGPCPPTTWPALGGVLFQGGDLAEHLAAYPAPPADFTAAGLVGPGAPAQGQGPGPGLRGAGRRRAISTAGWRMDVWRRASERRLLKGNWMMGLQDLKVALVLAEQGSGTASLRKRLRQWAEQALVLALAEGDRHGAGDPGTGAASPAGRGARRPSARDRALGRSPGAGGTAADPPADRKPRALDRIVETGRAPAVVPADDARRQELRDAADRSRGPLWFRWGR